MPLNSNMPVNSSKWCSFCPYRRSPWTCNLGAVSWFEVIKWSWWWTEIMFAPCGVEFYSYRVGLGKAYRNVYFSVYNFTYTYWYYLFMSSPFQKYIRNSWYASKTWNITVMKIDSADIQLLLLCNIITWYIIINHLYKKSVSIKSWIEKQ